MTRPLAVLCVVTWMGCGVPPESRGIEEGVGGSAGESSDGGTAGTQQAPGGVGGAQSLDDSANADPKLANDAGAKPDSRGPAEGSTDALTESESPPPGWVPAIVGVGYAGIRALSKDLGKTWPVHPALEAGPGNDDGDLLRGVAYGKGMWLTGGWQHLISTDGVNWVKSPLPKGCGLLEGIAYGNGMFIATCGDGDTFISNDGHNWRNGKPAATGHHTNIVFGISGGVGMFAVSGDTGSSFTSTDGMKWTNLPGVSRVRYCRGDFHSSTSCPGFNGHDVWLRFTDKLTIERSLDAKSWSKTDTFASYIGWFAFGYAPP
jgi:hypothetical protein